MEKIKSFMYLDYDKVYSFSSQVFEGLVDTFVESESEKISEREEQKGPISSGKKLGNILSKEKYRTENKFLHDYVYNLFEEKLISQNRIEIVENINADSLNAITESKFIKVKGRIIFNDSEAIIKIIRDFNKIGKAIGTVSIKGENQQAKQTVIDQYIRTAGLQLDKKFTDSLAEIIEFGLKDLIELQMIGDGVEIKVPVQEEYLKQNKQSIINGYSRKTQMEFFVVGIVTQSLLYNPIEKAETNNMNSNGNDYHSIREVLKPFIENMLEVEDGLTGKGKNEIVIEPIAIYTEI